MADTYEAFYNGKPLNPNRGLPTMTYAQAEDCGLTESERLWCRTDGEDTPVTADDIPYDSNNSVKDKIPQTITKQITTDANGGATLDINANSYVVMSATKLRDSTESTFAWGGLGRLVDGSYTIHLMTYDNQNFANKTCNVEVVYMKR